MWCIIVAEGSNARSWETSGSISHPYLYKVMHNLGQTLKNQLLHPSFQNSGLHSYFHWQQGCSSPALPRGSTALTPQLFHPPHFFHALAHQPPLLSELVRPNRNHRGGFLLQKIPGIASLYHTETSVKNSRWYLYEIIFFHKFRTQTCKIKIFFMSIILLY